MNDRVVLEGIQTFGHHGVLDSEKQQGQEFVVDVVLEGDFSQPARTDNLQHAVDYSRVHEQVRLAVAQGSFNLIERLAGYLCRLLLESWDLQAVEVTVEKSHPPIADFAGRARVTLRRERSWLETVPYHVWLGLGSNQGPRLENLQRAVDWVEEDPQLEMVAASKVYETDYVGPGQQDPYLNACLEIRASIPPLGLLAAAKSLETRLGRPAHGHLMPRPLDVDLLLVDDLAFSWPDLTVPHPGLSERLFVLAPLEDLVPEKKIPNSGETVASCCAKIRRKGGPRVQPRPDLELRSASAGRIMEE